jgi:hypothetical protein
VLLLGLWCCWGLLLQVKRARSKGEVVRTMPEIMPLTNGLAGSSSLLLLHLLSDGLAMTQQAHMVWAVYEEMQHTLLCCAVMRT